VSDIEVTMHITSYNRPQRLRGCIESFFSSCEYDMSKLELIIVDNGSDNEEVLSYIKNLEVPCAEYRYILNDKNDYPSCLRFAKIQARRIAKGNYFVDCPDDHMFVVKSDWISENIELLEYDNTAGCIIHFAQPEYRYAKANNKMIRLPNGLLRSCHKGYADYHIMRREVYKELGEYEYQLGREAEDEYMDRALKAGYHRNIMKIPVAFVNDDGYSFVNTIESDKLVEYFENQKIPITNEQMIALSLHHNLIQK